MSLVTSDGSYHRLKDALVRVHKAITVEGRSPRRHKQTMRRHRMEWPTLWEALDNLMKVIDEDVL